MLRDVLTMLMQAHNFPKFPSSNKEKAMEHTPQPLYLLVFSQDECEASHCILRHTFGNVPIVPKENDFPCDGQAWFASSGEEPSLLLLCRPVLLTKKERLTQKFREVSNRNRQYVVYIPPTASRFHVHTQRVVYPMQARFGDSSGYFRTLC